MKIRKNTNVFLYFIFPFINGLKKLFYFLHFKLLITLLVTCLIINIFFESLRNDTFSNLKLNVFIIIFIIICNNKYLKQVVLINHSWISLTLQRGWGFFPKKGEVGKLVQEGC